MEATLLALLAALGFVLMAFGIDRLGTVSVLWLAVACLVLHFSSVFPMIPIPWPRPRSQQ